ncbi:hypothetical protein GW17_00008029 [Ensete ventricosum]|nr:hypothetical protein GW17_00008029 [Ensete ventricosum]RZS20519.1 hypothetical protein BHM03_00053055 [Ensete ventricosum]
MRRMMSDYRVETVDDGTHEFFVDFHGPKESLVQFVWMLSTKLGAPCMVIEKYCLKYAKPEDIGASPEEESSDEEPSENEYDSSDEQMLGKPDP